MATTKSRSSSKEKAPRSKKDRSRTRHLPSATSSARSSELSPLSHSRTASGTSTVMTATRGRTKSGSGEEQSLRPTTAPESKPSQFGSLLQPGPMPPLPLSAAAPSAPSLLRAETVPSQSQTSLPEPQLDRNDAFDDFIKFSDTTESKHDSGEQLAIFGSTEPRLSKRQSELTKESGYKSKRPPPIVSNLVAPQAPQSSKSPSPSSAKSLGRTLTEKLFGRKPSGRRSMVRAALSDDPEPMPVPPMPPSASTLGSDVSSPRALLPDAVNALPPGPPRRPSRPPELLFTPDSATVDKERPLLPTSQVSDETERERNASLAALGGTQESTAAPERHAERSSSKPLEATSLQTSFNFELTKNDVSQKAEPSDRDLRRASIDSASSYGSIGFTERTFSSRSTPPPAEDRTKRAHERFSAREVDEENLLPEMPAPLRPRVIEPPAESPTDPFCVNGRLSPIHGREEDKTQAQAPSDATSVPQSETEAAAHAGESHSAIESDSEAEQLPPPRAGFRPRKQSLSGYRAGIVGPTIDVDREVPVPKIPDNVTSSEPQVQPHWRPRKDSIASIGSRNGIKGICRGCEKAILSTQKSVSSADGRLSGKYHKACFACRTCQQPFATAEFYVHKDQPYCAQHYHHLADSLCATCGHGIEGLYMETANVAGRGKEKHHPACLKCATCRVQLSNDYFELSGKVYCERDAFRLASHPRVHNSRGPARPSPLVREYIRSGDPGAIKGANFPERRTNRPMLEVR
jgi:hypothetical protein